MTLIFHIVHFLLNTTLNIVTDMSFLILKYKGRESDKSAMVHILIYSVILLYITQAKAFL